MVILTEIMLEVADKLANMVVDMEVDKMADNMAEMVVDMKVGMVADELANMEIHK